MRADTEYIWLAHGVSGRRTILLTVSLTVGMLFREIAPTWASPAHGLVSRPADAAPSMAQIKKRLRHTLEIGAKGEYFRPVGKPLTIKDGRSRGTLTAVVGGRYPTGDGLGQIVFFWHNTTFIGLSSKYETTAVDRLTSRAPGNFVIKYANYKPSDPTCCPSLPPRTVSYGWSGHILISNGVPPKPSRRPPTVRYHP